MELNKHGGSQMAASAENLGIPTKMRSLSGAGSLWGMGPTAADLVDLVRGSDRAADPLMRQRLARLWVEGEILRLLRYFGND